jgi:integrase
LVDRKESPWDDPNRRPSHADKRRAWRREMLAEGQSYVNEQTGKYDNWSSVWQTIMERVMKETKVTERFTEHDLRAKAGSDVESDERARELLGHSSVGITRRVYRRKALVIRPAK